MTFFPVFLTILFIAFGVSNVVWFTLLSFDHRIFAGKNLKLPYGSRGHRIFAGKNLELQGKENQ